MPSSSHRRYPARQQLELAGLLVLGLWVSVKWRGPTGIVYDFLNYGGYQLRAVDLYPVGTSFCYNPFAS